MMGITPCFVCMPDTATVLSSDTAVREEMWLYIINRPSRTFYLCIYHDFPTSIPWGQMTHICGFIWGSGNSLTPVRRQSITRDSHESCSIGRSRTNVSGISIKISNLCIKEEYSKYSLQNTCQYVNTAYLYATSQDIEKRLSTWDKWSQGITHIWMKWQSSASRKQHTNKWEQTPPCNVMN